MLLARTHRSLSRWHSWWDNHLDVTDVFSMVQTVCKRCKKQNVSFSGDSWFQLFPYRVFSRHDATMLQMWDTLPVPRYQNKPNSLSCMTKQRDVRSRAGMRNFLFFPSFKINPLVRKYYVPASPQILQKKYVTNYLTRDKKETKRRPLWFIRQVEVFFPPQKKSWVRGFAWPGCGHWVRKTLLTWTFSSANLDLNPLSEKYTQTVFLLSSCRNLKLDHAVETCCRTIWLVETNGETLGPGYTCIAHPPSPHGSDGNVKNLSRGSVYDKFVWMKLCGFSFCLTSVYFSWIFPSKVNEVSTRYLNWNFLAQSKP